MSVGHQLRCYNNDSWGHQSIVKHLILQLWRYQWQTKRSHCVACLQLSPKTDHMSIKNRRPTQLWLQHVVKHMNGSRPFQGGLLLSEKLSYRVLLTKRYFIPPAAFVKVPLNIIKSCIQSRSYTTTITILTITPGDLSRINLWVVNVLSGFRKSKILISLNSIK